ncbi:MAG: histidine--tRNA ligase [Treponema sp.]|jgi:histidyl-tRNA synthetase|nr:histidine--tRNA ligase [Treponema sp.]
MNIIEPRVLKGFRDFPPSAEIERRGLIENIEASFRSFGFAPIDTPALEYAEILLGKGGGETEKQVYRFTDNGGRDVALRFDLTVPFARFIAARRSEITLPFKRYHIAKVWRGENTQRGRYREFTQCDVDIVGSNSPASDFEILLVMRDTLKAIGAGDVTIHINHRGLFNRFLATLGLLDKSVDILRLVDKSAKIGRDAVVERLAGIAGGKAEKILQFIEAKGDFEEVLARLTGLSGGPSPESGRLAALRAYMLQHAAASGAAGGADAFTLDPSITRGLDYYTGIVYETFLNDMPEIGSICSGGRYDNLASLYSKENISGVGTSIGLDRLIAALEALGRLEQRVSYARIAVACLKEADAGAYQAIAGRFRDAGLACEVFFAEEKLAKQYMTAEKKGVQWLIIPPLDNPLRGNLTLRNLAARENSEPLSIEEAAARLKAVLEA